MPSAVAVAAAPILAGYRRFRWKEWRNVVGRLLHHGSQDFQWDALSMLAWSLLFRLLVRGAAGVLVYWVSGLYR